MVSPLERGLKGGVTLRGAVWVEVFFLGGVCLLWVVAFDLRRLCAGVTHPRPLSRGEVVMLLFYFVMRDLWHGDFPS